MGRDPALSDSYHQKDPRRELTYEKRTVYGQISGPLGFIPPKRDPVGKYLRKKDSYGKT